MIPARAAIAACAGAFLLMGCARDLHVRLPAPADEPTGSITVVLTQPATDLTVAINGTLVADRAHTEKVRVDGVIAGMADVVIAAGGGAERVERHLQVIVDAGGHVNIPIGAPEKSMGSAMKMGVFTVAAWVLSRAIYLAFF
jgi:hypothetical protein